MLRIAVLGSTGSIGTSCLDVIRAHPEQLHLHSIAARSSWDVLSRQIAEFKPRTAVLSNTELQGTVSSPCRETELCFGADAIEKMAADPDVDVVVSGIVGSDGLAGTWAALESGKRVCLANKETLVMAGSLAMDLARRTGATLIPVDSEHSAVFQALQSGRRADLQRIVLTASGGPFRGWKSSQLQGVTPEMALAHPTWKMGRKISVDSATMMNKALEVIEARWLFDLQPDQIEVVVHPQSIVHSFVEFIDGSILSQLSPPDMKLPIQYALTYPERWEGISPRLDWNSMWKLDFEPPDYDSFPALRLGFEVAERGGTSGAVLNAANEAAVERFLAGDLPFCDIPRACRGILETHEFDPTPGLADLLRLDRWARKEIYRWRS